MKTSRSEALSDGIFAIAMTLLILEVRVPTMPNPVTGAALWNALVGLEHHVAGYAVSFIILGTLWIGQHNQFHLIDRVDRTLLWLNVFFLLCIAFLPFATAFLAEYHTQPIACVLYGATLLAAGGFLYAHWAYATKDRRLVSSDLAESVVRAVKRRIVAGFAVYGAAAGLSFLNTKIALALFAIMPIIYMLPGKVDPHLKSSP
jgi:uncharacterized membrane protein